MGLTPMMFCMMIVVVTRAIMSPRTEADPLVQGGGGPSTQGAVGPIAHRSISLVHLVHREASRFLQSGAGPVAQDGARSTPLPLLFLQASQVTRKTIALML
jgi:hypothetical protein